MNCEFDIEYTDIYIDSLRSAVRDLINEIKCRVPQKEHFVDSFYKEVVLLIKELERFVSEDFNGFGKELFDTRVDETFIRYFQSLNFINIQVTYLEDYILLDSSRYVSNPPGNSILGLYNYIKTTVIPQLKAILKRTWSILLNTLKPQEFKIKGEIEASCLASSSINFEVIFR